MKNKRTTKKGFFVCFCFCFVLFSFLICFVCLFVCLFVRFFGFVLFLFFDCLSTYILHKNNKIMYYNKLFHCLYFYQSGDPTGLYDLIVSPDVTVLQGCGLGGTSLINANVALECEPKIFEDEVSTSNTTNEKKKYDYCTKQRWYIIKRHGIWTQTLEYPFFTP